MFVAGMTALMNGEAPVMKHWQGISLLVVHGLKVRLWAALECLLETDVDSGTAVELCRNIGVLVKPIAPARAVLVADATANAVAGWN